MSGQMQALVPRALVVGGAAPGANTNILASSITPYQRCALRVTVALATASVFNIMVGAVALGLNESVALNAGDLYTFSVGADPSMSVNFQVETNGIIRLLIVDEVQGGVL